MSISNFGRTSKTPNQASQWNIFLSDKVFWKIWKTLHTLQVSQDLFMKGSIYHKDSLPILYFTFCYFPLQIESTLRAFEIKFWTLHVLIYFLHIYMWRFWKIEWVGKIIVKPKSFRNGISFIFSTNLLFMILKNLRKILVKWKMHKILHGAEGKISQNLALCPQKWITKC